MSNDQQRGEEAGRILEAPIYKEAYRVIEERLVNELAQAEIKPERAEYVRTLLVSTRTVRKYLEQVLLTGKMAAMEEVKKLTILDKVRKVF